MKRLEALIRSRPVIFDARRSPKRRLGPRDLPWEAVHSKVTQECYERRSRQFLVFAGHMDPALWSNKNPTKAAAEAEGRETERAMIAFIRASTKDPAKARQQVLSFIEDLKRRMNEKDSSKRVTSA